jgi:hypothetical protein
MVDIGTALTLLLAIATFVLAWQTAKMASATRESVDASTKIATAATDQAQAAHEQADLTREALDANIQPILVDVPWGMFPKREPIQLRGTGFDTYVDDLGALVISDEDGVVYGSVPFRNVGPGAALVTTGGVRFGPDVWVPGRVSKTVVPANELTRVSFSVPKDRPDLREYWESVINGGAAAELYYRSVGGTQLFRSVASIWRNSAGTHFIRQVLLYKGDESEPFAVSGPADG